MTLDKKKKGISFGFTSIAIASAFLFNSNINIIDIIPDVIGYIIMSIALVNLSFLSEDIAKAAKNFRYMILVGLFKFVSFIWLVGLKRPDEQSTGTLLMTFVFAVIEVTILYIAYSDLFGGLQSLGFLHKNTAVLGKKRGSDKSHTERIKRATLFFLVLKAGVTLLPEFATLSQYSYAYDSPVGHMYEFIGLMRGMAFIFVTAFGISWMVKFIKYFRRLNKDVEFKESLTEKYNEEVLAKQGIKVKFNLGVAFSLFLFALIFVIDIRLNDFGRMEKFNLLPDFVAAILFLLGSIFIKKCNKKAQRFLSVSAWIYLVISLVAYVVEFIFYDKYYYTAIFRSVEAYRCYIIMCAAETLSTVAFIVLAYAFVLSLYQVITDHTGFVYGSANAQSAEKLAEYHKESATKLVYVIIGAMLVTAADVFYIFFAEKYGFAGALCMIAGIIFISTSIKAMYEIKSDVEIKYMLE